MTMHTPQPPQAPVSPSEPERREPVVDATETETEPQTEVTRRIKLGAAPSQREMLLQGRRAFDRGDDQAALESLTRLVTHGVRFADVRYMVGMIEERRGDLDSALHQLQEATRINPSYVEALLALASLHERRGEYDQSQNYAERASQLSRPTAAGLDPTTRGKLANQQASLADALVQAGERRDAIEQYRGALDRCPTFHDIRHRLAVTLREAGLPAQAAQELQRILRLHPGFLESQVQLGLTYYSMGRTPEAISEWVSVLEKDPSRDEARMYLRLVRGTNANSEANRNPSRPQGQSAHTQPLPTASKEKELDEEIAFGAVTSVAPLSPSTLSTPTPLPTGAAPTKADSAGRERPEIGWKTTELSTGRDA